MEEMQDFGQEKQVKEDYAIVLDFLPHGYPFDTRPSHKKTAIAQAIGKTRFIILELVPKKEIFLQPHEEVYIGEGKRDKIHHIVSRLTLEKLTATARNELEFVIRELLKTNSQKFIDFFNKAQPLTTRMHQLELIPGFGKKHMWEVIEQREIKPFVSFEDLKSRVKLIPDPEKAIVKRILQELSGTEKHYLFIDS